MKKIFIVALVLLSCVSCKGKVKHYRVEVVKEYSHDTKAYTQGLFFQDGQLYESTGQYGESSFRKVDLASGKVQQKIDFASKYFGEGSVIMNGKMYMLTWTNKVAFVYDAATLEYIQSYRYPREGWGLTTDGKNLIASDGTSRLYFLDADLKLEHSVSVNIEGKPVRYINELEWIDGKIWANVYTSDVILIINPKNGNVEATIDCTGLLPRSLRKPDTDVLNGIAHNPQTGRTYITGKNWPRLYEVKLVEKK